jgi:DNA-binding LytR/AlgR family response regulator
MRVLIIEDEISAADHLQYLLARIDPGIEIANRIDTIRASVNWLSKNTADLIFLDIHLADGLSFSIFDQITVSSPIIFTTAYDQYAIRAFKLNSLDYLLKPIQQEELEQSLEKINQLKKTFGFEIPDLKTILSDIRTKREFQKRFIIQAGSKIRFIKTSDIAYFYSSEKNTFLCTFSDQHYDLDQTLDKIETLVDPVDFFRVNRKYLIHIDSIKNMATLSKTKIEIDLDPPAQEDVLVSVRRIPDFKQWLNK